MCCKNVLQDLCSWSENEVAEVVMGPAHNYIGGCQLWSKLGPQSQKPPLVTHDGGKYSSPGQASEPPNYSEKALEKVVWWCGEVNISSSSGISSISNAWSNYTPKVKVEGKNTAFWLLLYWVKLILMRGQWESLNCLLSQRTANIYILLITLEYTDY